MGLLFRAAREAQHLSQDQLAAMTGGPDAKLSRTMISSIERGRHSPGLETLVCLTRALHVDPAEVFERVDLAMAQPVDLTGVGLDELNRRARESFWAGDFRTALATYDAMLERLVLDPPEDAEERTRQHARVEINRAAALRRCGALKASRGAAERAIALAERSPGLQAEAYTVLASLLNQMANLPLARDASNRAVELSAKGDIDIQVHAWTGRGAILYRSGSFEEARRAFLEAGALGRRASDRHHLVHIEGNIGMCLLGLGRREQARKRLMNAVELARKQAVPALEASWLVELGRIALDQQLLDEADRYTEAALRIARPREHLSTVFRAEWVRHLVARRRDPRAADRQRLAYLRKLFLRLEDRDLGEVREFREEVMTPRDAQQEENPS